MPATERSRREPTDDWDQLRLLVASHEQATYELLRPLVLFGQLVRARAREQARHTRLAQAKLVRDRRGRQHATLAQQCFKARPAILVHAASEYINE